ncbi:MAG: ABC-F family ATPase [Acidobacteria bacterium]|nr:MAG: ABC-F family ATPase [Acidobacteriota bacterium]
MITLTDISKQFGAQNLFEDVNLQLDPGNRYGLVGANGSGKSTLLRIITGDEEASTGKVAMPRSLTLGVLKQDHFEYENTPILEVAMMGHQGLWQAMEEKEAVLATEPFDSDRYGDLEDLILSHDGYTFEARCAEILEGLGIPTAQHRQPLSTLSGGFKFRVLLAQTLASNPGCLLLDEPTNHLDILSIRWLETFLVDYSGCALVISHDHRFLNTVCTHILDVDYRTITPYTGNYRRFEEAKVSNRNRKEAEISKREKQIAQHKAFADRFRAKATKARQAQSKLKAIERIELEELAPSSRRHPKFGFAQRRPSGKTVLEIEGLHKAYGDNRVLEGVDLTIRRGDRLAIIGPNGIGKSTLLKILMNIIPADSGEVLWGHETHPGYFAQDHKDIFGDRTGTVEGFLGEAAAGRDTGWVRGRLGRVLFSREEVEKKLDALSGGESTRLIFARLSVDEPNVLVLDEPTNHLDLEAIEALVQALEAYDGTIILVSHDRWFVSRLANRILEITPDGINDFRGSYEEYLERCGDDHLDSRAVLKKAREQKRQKKGRKNGNQVQPVDDEKQRLKRQKDLKLRLGVVENSIEEAEKKIEKLDALFCRPDFYDSRDDTEIRRLTADRDTLKSEVERLTTEWETLGAEVET